MSLSVQVLAKTPLRGRVKTRLAGVLGDHGSLQLARRQLDRTLAVAIRARVGPVTLRVTDGPWHPFVREAGRRHGVRLAAQAGADLGARMAAAVREGLSEGDGVILLGTDCPGLEAADLTAARERLESGCDVVLGPAADGGYYLAALARPAPALFRGLAWGGTSVLARSLIVLRQGGRCVALLSERRDLDRPADLVGSPFLAGVGGRFQR